MNKSKRARIFRPRYRLTDMVDRPGGIKRDAAIARALREEPRIYWCA